MGRLPKVPAALLAALMPGMDLGSVHAAVDKHLQLTPAGFVLTAADKGEGWCEKHQVNHKPTTHCPYKDKQEDSGKDEPDDTKGYGKLLEELKAAIPAASLMVATTGPFKDAFMALLEGETLLPTDIKTLSGYASSGVGPLNLFNALQGMIPGAVEVIPAPPGGVPSLKLSDALLKHVKKEPKALAPELVKAIWEDSPDMAAHLGTAGDTEKKAIEKVLSDFDGKGFATKLDWVKELRAKIHPILDGSGATPLGVAKKIFETLENKGKIVVDGSNLVLKLDGAEHLPPAAPAAPPAPFTPAKSLSETIAAAGTFAGSVAANGLKVLHDANGKGMTADEVLAGISNIPSNLASPIAVVKKYLNKAVQTGALTLQNGKYAWVGTGGASGAPQTGPAAPQAPPPVPSPTPTPQNAPPAAPVESKEEKIKKGLEVAFGELVGVDTKVFEAPFQDAMKGLEAGQIPTLAAFTLAVQNDVYDNAIAAGIDEPEAAELYEAVPTLLNKLLDIGVIKDGQPPTLVTDQEPPTATCPDGHNTYKSPAPPHCPTCGKAYAKGGMTAADVTPALISDVLEDAKKKYNWTSGTDMAKMAEGFKKHPNVLLGKEPISYSEIVNDFGGGSFGLFTYTPSQGGKYIIDPKVIPDGEFGPYSHSLEETSSKILDGLLTSDAYLTKTTPGQAALKPKLEAAAKKLAEKAANGTPFDKSAFLTILGAAGVPTPTKYIQPLITAGVFKGVGTSIHGFIETLQVPSHAMAAEVQPLPENPALHATAISDLKAFLTQQGKAPDEVEALSNGVKKLDAFNGGFTSFEEINTQALSMGITASQLVNKSGLTHFSLGGKNMYTLAPESIPPGQTGPYASSVDDAQGKAFKLLTDSPALAAKPNTTKTKLKNVIADILTWQTENGPMVKTDPNGVAKIYTSDLSGVLVSNGVPGPSAIVKALVGAGLFLEHGPVLVIAPALQLPEHAKPNVNGPPVQHQPGQPPTPQAPTPPSPAAAVSNIVGSTEGANGVLKALKNAFGTAAKQSGATLVNAIANGVISGSKDFVSLADAKVKATAVLDALKASGAVKVDTAGDYTASALPAVPPSPLTVPVPDMASVLTGLGWNPGGKGEKALKALNANGDDGNTIADVVKNWGGNAPNPGLIADILDKAIGAGVVKRVPNTQPAKYLFTNVQPPPAPSPTGAEPSGKCPDGHNTYKSPVPPNCPTCGKLFQPNPALAQAAKPVSKKMPATVDEFPDTKTFTFVGDAKALGGIKPKGFYDDPATGVRYLFKPDDEGVRPLAAQAASIIGAAILGPDAVVPVKAATDKNGQVGSFQPYHMDVKSDASAIPLSAMTKPQKDGLVKEKVFDWLIGSHDTKPGNFVVKENGQVLGIDKEQAFKWIGSDQLNTTYKPNPSKPIYNDLFQGFADKTLDLDLDQADAVIKAVEAIPDEKYVEMVKPYLDGAAQRYGWGDGKKKERLDAILKRKQNIRKDFEKFFSSLTEARGEGPFAFQSSGAVKPPTTPGAIPGAPAPGQQSVSSKSLPDAKDLKHDGPAQVGGAKPKSFYSDASGKKYLFKPAPEGAWRADVQAAVADIASLILPPGTFAPVKSTTDKNGEVGTIQPWLPIKQNFVNTLAAAGGDFSKLSKQHLDGLQREKVLDWLVGNHDSHGKNLIELADGSLAGVDKEQAFKTILNDQLNTTYHPNAQYGESPPVANDFFNAYAGKKVDIDPMATFDTIKRIEAIPDASYMAMLQPYIDGISATKPNPTAFKNAITNAILKRKQNIRTDFEKFYTDLRAARGEGPFKYPS